MAEFIAHPYPWHLAQWQDFSKLVQQEKLPHAIMLAGPRKIGKLQLARSLAFRLLCETPQDGYACGSCRACLLNKAETHPDLLFLSPEEGGKTIKVDQVRKLTQFLGKTAQQGGYKLVLIDPVEAMNANSANALLKSLEEPSGQTLILLVCHNPSLVLPTIRSRCQMRLLPIPSSEVVVNWLQPLVAHQSAPALVLEAEGAPLAALELLNGDGLDKRERYLASWISLSLGHASAIDMAGDWQEDTSEFLLDWYLSWLLRVARWKTAGHEPLVAKTPDQWRSLLSSISPNHLHRYIEKIILSKRQLLSGANPNKQLLWEEILLDWQALIAVARKATLAAGQA